MTNIFKDKENTGSSFCLFLLNMLICAFSAPKSKASTLFHSVPDNKNTPESH